MEDMIERVARAICRAYFYCDLDTPDGRAHWRSNQSRCMKEARAAIEAMREPTGAMVTDGSNVPIDMWDGKGSTFADDPTPVWTAMVRAALKEPEPLPSTPE